MSIFSKATSEEESVFSQIYELLQKKEIFSWGEDYFENDLEFFRNKPDQEKAIFWKEFIFTLSKEDLEKLETLKDEDMNIPDDLRNVIFALWYNHPSTNKSRLRRKVKEAKRRN